MLPWTDLHLSIIKLNIDGTTGALLSSLVELWGAKPNYSDGRCFWAMNRYTHTKLMNPAFSAAAWGGVHNQMPIIGGDIVGWKCWQQRDYRQLRLRLSLRERRESIFEHAKFQQMLTGFRATPDMTCRCLAGVCSGELPTRCRYRQHLPV